MKLEKTVHLEKLNAQNQSDYLSLQVLESQKSFIETPLKSLSDMENHAWNIPWCIECIYAEDLMIGYTMHGINSKKDVWLDRFMIDKRYQHHGYGTAALRLILSRLKQLYPERSRILLSVEPENEFAIQLYQQFGFRMAGYVEDNEEVMILQE